MFVKLFKIWSSKKNLAIFLLMCSQTLLWAQDQYTLNGVVTIEAYQEPAVGVTILIKGTDTGTVTDFDGNYSIDVSSGDILEFSYLGFKTETIIISGQKSQDVILLEDTSALEEVVVVGYGTQKKKTVTSSISKVSGETLKNTKVARVEDALVGRVSGVQISAANTEAGGDPQIKVRGVGSITGNSNPLIVVDGIPLGTDSDILGTIDMNNVKSVDVLKDASSAAIYGSRGANGVISITMKEGVVGEPVFTYDTFLGTKWVPHNDGYTGTIGSHLNYLDQVKAGLESETDADIIADLTEKLNTGYANMAAAQVIADAAGGETNWQDVMMPGGVIKSHTFSASGGTEASKYSASVGYLHDEGVLLEDDFKRYNASINFDSKTKNKKVKFGAKIRANLTDQKRATDLYQLLRQASYNPTYITEDLLPYINTLGENSRGVIDFTETEVGDYALERMFDHIWDYGTDENGIRDGSIVLNPEQTGNLSLNTTGDNSALAKALERNRTKEQSTVNASAYLDFKLAKNLNFKQRVTGEARNTIDRDIRSTLFHQNGSARAERDERSRTRKMFTVESTLRFKEEYGKHNIDAIAGYEYNKWFYTDHDTDATGFEDDTTTAISLANLDTNTLTRFGEDILVSYFGRFTYDFDDKYLLQTSIRTDGSSRFGRDTKYGVFPAVSVGWIASNESFLYDSEVISNLKLRLSYGLTGSNSIDNDVFQSLYRYQTTLSPVSYAGLSGTKDTTVANSNLGWESLVEYDFGLDVSLLNNAINVTADYYNRTSKDLILDMPIASAYGVATSLQNIGKVENTGFELEVNSNIYNRGDFSWSTTGTITTNENEVLDFGGADQLISRIEDAKRPTEFLTQVGGPISTFYGYVYDKEIPLHYLDNPFVTINGQAQRVYVKDLNGDGILNSDDRTVLGDPYPDFIWSLSNNFTYKDFDFSFMFQGSHGAQVRVSDLEYLKNEFKSGLDVETDVTDTFNITNLEDSEFIKKRYFTSDHIQDASYVALRNINLGYTFPSDLTDRLKISRLRLYVTGENLLYLTHSGYFGFNPEGTMNYTSRNANTPVTAGYQRTGSPIPRTITMGLNLKF